MNNAVGDSLRGAIRKLGMGRKVRRDDLRIMRQTLLDRLGIQVVIDVGANIGQYASSLRAFGYSGRIISVEPLPEAFQRLRRAAETDHNWTCLQCGIGAADATLQFHIAADDKCSSFLQPTADFSRALRDKPQVQRRIEVPVRTLDAIWREQIALDMPVYVKLDVQGYEIEALRGGDGLALPHASALELELSLTACYEGQADFLTVLNALAKKDYAMVNLARVAPDHATGRLMQVDGIFERGVRPTTSSR